MHAVMGPLKKALMMLLAGIDGEATSTCTCTQPTGA